ncbi:hypothetical protein TrispH2_005961 [Trichoplax sp. H2]|nr:hypothetical protein TrispH2_005961 [Trichoplax sp. H2]|eukprot:RDD41103.1 hypothetical protein TrispH2_005961 [Trichoplax sp. H2]
MSEQHQDEPHSPVTKSSAADGERQVGIIKLAAIQIKTEASSVYEKTDGIHCYDAMQDGNKSPSQGNEDCHDNLSPEDPLKHSDSNLSDELEVDQNSFSNLFKHPYIRKQWRSIALAGVLLLAGFSFLMTGVILIINHSSDTKSLVFFLCSALCLLPSVYQIGITFSAIRQRKDYNLQTYSLD